MKDAGQPYPFEFPERPLAGRVIALAGGTGGLGAATAELLARQGSRIILGYRANHPRAHALAQYLQQRYGCPLQLVAGAIEDPATRQAYQQAAARWGGLDGLAVFAGQPVRVPWEQIDRAALETSIEANFLGPILLARELGEAMEAEGREGAIVLLASMQAVAAFSSSLPYGAAKAALVHAARILARQWLHVRVNVVAPGVTVAGMAAASVAAGKYDVCLERRMVARFGRAEQVARVVSFLLEPDHYLTGQLLVVDGGLTLRATP